MKRKTHILMGAAVTVPVAAVLSPVGAIGCIWFGMAGGALPDYLDFRSDARQMLKHRGISHSFAVLVAAGVFAWYVLGALHRAEFQIFPVPARYVRPWAMSLSLGMLSHVLGDACTRGGIQPFLPLSRKRLWLLPKALRGRSDGKINHLAGLISVLMLGAGVLVFAFGI